MTEAYWIECRHSGKGREFVGTFADCIASIKDGLVRAGDAFAVYEQPSNRRIATVALQAGAGIGWFDAWTHPAYADKL